MGGFKKCSKSVKLGVKIHIMNTPMKPMQFICGNNVFSEFSKCLSHMSHIFLRKLIKVTFLVIYNMNSVIILW